MKKTILALIVPFALMLCTALGARNKGARAAPKALVPPQGFVTETKNYRKDKEPRANQVVVVYPEKTRAKLPIVVFIHGGGWAQGDKDQMAWLCSQYAKRGYLGASISYRLVHEAPFPACIFDVKEALRFIKLQCKKDWPGDPNRIGLMGYSAGAHLALMIALTPHQEAFKTSAYAEMDSSVKCAFGVSTPTDFVSRIENGKPFKVFSSSKQQDLDFVKLVSPLHNIHKDQVPICMVHGTKDALVPPIQYQSFENKCRDMGIANFQLELEHGGDHNYFWKHKKHQRLMRDFFDQNLRPKQL